MYDQFKTWKGAFMWDLFVNLYQYRSYESISPKKREANHCDHENNIRIVLHPEGYRQILIPNRSIPHILF